MRRPYTRIFVILLIIYLTLTFTAPIDPKTIEKYDISSEQLRLLSLSIVLPLTAVYLSALYGFLRFKDYANSIRKSKEGPHLRKIATGLMVLAFSLPITAVTSALFDHIKHSNPDFLPSSVILKNYMALAFIFVALLFIAKGAQGLFNTLKIKDQKKSNSSGILGPIILASSFTWLITAQQYQPNEPPGYYMPLALVIITLAIPFIYIWCVGIRAVTNLRKYRTNVAGTLYKQAFDNLSKGLAIIIIISIALQLLSTLSSAINNLKLGAILLIVYLLVVLYGAGYGLVAIGAKKLKRIEEV